MPSVLRCPPTLDNAAQFQLAVKLVPNLKVRLGFKNPGPSYTPFSNTTNLLKFGYAPDGGSS